MRAAASTRDMYSVYIALYPARRVRVRTDSYVYLANLGATI